jgi:hypothetical protein
VSPEFAGYNGCLATASIAQLRQQRGPKPDSFSGLESWFVTLG